MSKQEEWVLGPEDTPFYTTTWSPKDAAEPSACVLFVHGFAEHVARYDRFFTLLSSPPHNLRITAFDQRGHGRTAYHPLTSSSPEVQAWEKEGKHVKLAVNTKRKTGGWAKAIPDMEWFIKREADVAKGLGKSLFLWGHSMGGGQSLGFCTRTTPPPAKDTVTLLSGVIASSPEIKLTKPAPAWQLVPGSVAARLGFGDVVIDAPIKVEDLTHDTAIQDACAADPMCEAKGSLKGLSDMINNGEQLLLPQVLERWPKHLPLLMYHGDEDMVNSFKASKEYFEKSKAEDKHFKAFPGMRHELHNELEPTPSELAQLVAEWINARVKKAAPTPDTVDTSPTAQSKL